MGSARTGIALPLAIVVQAFVALLAPTTVLSQNSNPRPAESTDSLRAAIAREFAAIANSKDSAQENSFRRVHTLAANYARIHRDSFFVRRVARFEALTPLQRTQAVMADSLRVAGNNALTQYGIAPALELWRKALDHARKANEKSAIAPALIAIGAGFYRTGQFDSAMWYLNRGKAVAADIGDFRTLGNAVGILASVSKDRGAIATARKLYEEASTIRARSNDSRGIAADQNNLALIARQQGDLPAASLAFEHALAINRRDGRQNLAALNIANLAGVASDGGEYANADSLYRAALDMQRSTGDRAQTAFTLHDLGRLLIRRADYRGAYTALAEALKIHEESGAAKEAVSVRSDLSALQSAMGRPDDALITLQQADREAALAGVPTSVRGGLAMAHGDIAFEFGALTDAEQDYLRAEKLFTDADDKLGIASALVGRASILHLQGANADALRLLKKAGEAQRKMSDSRSAALTQLLVATVQHDCGDTSAATQSLVEARQTLHTVGDLAGEAAALDMLGNLALERSAISSAEKYFRAGLRALGKVEVADVRWRLHEGIADVSESRKLFDQAAAEYRIAIDLAERTSSRLGNPQDRYGFLSDKWSLYVKLSQLEHRRGNASEAFAVSERLRARQLVDMLGHGRIAAGNKTAAAEQDFRRRIDELNRHPIGALASNRMEEASNSWRDPGFAELRSVEDKHSRIITDLRERDPRYANLVSAATTTSGIVSSRLKSDEVLLEYLLGDSICTVFVVTNKSVEAVRLPLKRESVAQVVEFSRRALLQPENRAAPPLWRLPLRRLYRDLVEPIEQRGYLRGKRNLVIVPHGELHFLSFGALMSGAVRDEFLVERFNISYAPSATAWVQLAERRATEPGGRILLLAPDVIRLPASATEVNGIRRIYGARATVLTGSRASQRALRDALPNFGTLHFAAFGVLNRRNPLFSFVKLATTSTDDGRLEVNRVFDLPLSGQLVILSACQTALGAGLNEDVPPGDDWIGLVQGFLQGGASRVVASLWTVDDHATAVLMERFHKRVEQRQPPASALAEAQRETLRKAETRSPFFWAAFVMNGNSLNRL
jgi:CHAT domain-containing protein